MKRLHVLTLIGGSLFVLLLATLTLSSSLAQDATPNPGLPTSLPACAAYHVTANSANIRVCAAPGCGIVAQVAQNTMLCIRGEADTPLWLQVDLAPDDTTSPMYYVNASVVAPGAPGQSNPDDSCQSFTVDVDQVPVYSCAQANCSQLGTLKYEEWLCGRDYNNQYPGWLYAADSDSGLTGWVTRDGLIAGQVHNRPTRTPGPATWTPGPRTPQPTRTPAPPSVTPPPGPVTLNGPEPVCQLYHVTADRGQARTCAGSGCDVAATVKKDDILCIRGITDNPEWLIVDLKPEDETAPLSAIPAAIIAPGLANETVECEPWEVIAPVDANVRECPSLTCRTLGKIDRGAWVCARGYGGAYEDWVLADIPNGRTGVWISDSVLKRMDITGTPTDVPTGSPTPAAGEPAQAAPAATAATASPAAPTVTATATVTTTATPALPCQSYAVNVATANVRSCPSTDCSIVTKLSRSAPVCVLSATQDSGEAWFMIDLDPADPANASAYISANLVSTVAPGPGTPVAPTNTPEVTPTLAGPPTETPTPTPFVTLLPTPIFTPVPVTAPTTPLLAKEEVLSTLRVRNFELTSPRGSNRFRVQMPDDWYMDGNSVLYLNIEYFESRPPAEPGVPEVPLTAMLGVYLDNELVSSIALNNTVVGPQTLAIPLPPRLLGDPERSNHSFQFTLEAEDHCLLDSEARVFVRTDLSYFHFEFRETPPLLDLARYPRPFYNQRFEDQPEAVLMVLPLDVTDNDLQVAGRLSAGLGFLTGRGLEIKVVTAEDITDEEKQSNHLLLVGQIGTNPLIDDLYKADLLPTKLDSAGKLSVQETPVDENDGVVQLIANPQNPMRAIMTVTGLTPEAVMKAAQALAGPPSIMGLGGPLALVSETRPVTRPPAGTVLDTQYTFTELGYPEIAMNGIGVVLAEVNFYMPLGQKLTADAYLDLLYSYSDVLKTGKSTLAVLLNETTPLASEVLGTTDANSTSTAAGATPQAAGNGPNHLRAWIPATGIIPGERNTLTIVLNVEGDWNCAPPDPSVAFLTISGDSLLNLPREVAAQAMSTPMVGWFPIPFNTLSDLSDVWVSLPDSPTRAELEQAFRFVAMLGSSATNGEGFSPRIHVGELPTDTDLSAYNFIVLGRPSTNSFLTLLNDSMPQPFAPGTDQIEQTLDDVSYRLPPGYEIGVLETFTSPWSENHVVLVVTGTGADSQTNAANALLGDQYGRSQLLGDVVFVSQNSVSPVDTRQIEQNIEMLTQIPDLETETALVASATATPETAYTVTPGPTQTPIPTDTPGPTTTPTPLFTLTPAPTVPTAIPTFVPLEPNQIQPTKSALPDWFDILLTITAIVVLFALVVGLLRLLRRGRQRVV